MQPLATDQNYQAHWESPCAHGNRRWNCLECDKIRNFETALKLNTQAHRIGSFGEKFFTVKQKGGTKGGQARWQIVGPDGNNLHRPSTVAVTSERLHIIMVAMTCGINAIRKARA